MDQFTFTDKAKKIFFALILIGIVTMAYGIFTGEDHGQRVWTSALINGWFFFSIALMGTTFIAINNASQSAWVVVLLRVFEAVSMYLPIGNDFSSKLPSLFVVVPIVVHFRNTLA